jgi:ACT domain-containing protein
MNLVKQEDLKKFNGSSRSTADNKDEYLLPETVLAKCLQKCNLTIKDLIEANMRNIIDNVKITSESRYTTAEEFVARIEHEIRNKNIDKLKQAM